MGAASRDGDVYQIYLPADGYTEKFTENVAKALVISAWLFLEGWIDDIPPRGPTREYPLASILPRIFSN